MSNKDKASLVPKLRFPEFRSEPGWQMRRIGDLLKETQRPIELVDGLEYRLVTVKRRYGGLVSRGNLKGMEIKVNSQFLVNIGDLLISKRQIVHNACGVVPSELDGSVVSNEYSVLTAKPGCNIDFFNWFAQQPSVSASFLECSVGIVIEKMLFKLNLWLKKEFPFPQLLEQQKIADCLSSLDELIAAQASKLDALKTHKKGLMQQLFPCDGETQPRLWFPEFQDSPEWEVKRLEDLSQRGSGHTPSKSSSEYYDGGIKWISLADSKSLDAGLISTTKIEISKQGIKNSSAVLHPAGTVLISRDAGVGKSAVMDIPMAVSQHFIVWTCNPSLLSNWFLYHLLQKLKPVFERNATGSTIKTIGLPFFKALCVSVPSLPEQHRIADILNSLDDLITSKAQELEYLKTHKKGLMQQLFPYAETNQYESVLDV